VSTPRDGTHNGHAVCAIVSTPRDGTHNGHAVCAPLYSLKWLHAFKFTATALPGNDWRYTAKISSDTS
jgi:hypothetical protein